MSDWPRRALLSLVFPVALLSACGTDGGADTATPVNPAAAATPTGASGAGGREAPLEPGVWASRPAAGCTEGRVQRWTGTHRLAARDGHVFASGRGGVREWDLRAGRERLLSAAPLNVSGLVADATHVYAWSANPVVRGRDSVQRLDLTTRVMTPVAEGLSGLAVNRLFVEDGQLYWMDTEPHVGQTHVMRLAGAGGAPESMRTLPRSQFRLGRSQAGHLMLHNAFEADYLVAPEGRGAQPDADAEVTADGFYEVRRDGFPREVTWRPMRGPERAVGSVELSGRLSYTADGEAVVVALEDAVLGELHVLPTAGGATRRIAQRLVLPKQPVLVDGCLFFVQGAPEASETVHYTRVHPARSVRRAVTTRR